MQLFLGGQSIEMGAEIIDTRPTRDPKAWDLLHYTTLRLTAPVSALRVHTGGKDYPSRVRSNEQGVWLMLGDVILTSGEILDSRSLPGPFTKVSEALLPGGAIINIGVASLLLAGTGGGVQVEFLDGPPIAFREIKDKYWHGLAGHS